MWEPIYFKLSVIINAFIQFDASCNDLECLTFFGLKSKPQICKNPVFLIIILLFTKCLVISLAVWYVVETCDVFETHSHISLFILGCLLF